jgi:DNA topoisomerase-1
LKIPRKSDDSKYTAEELAALPLEEVKKIIETQVPGAFTKKAPKKKGAAKKTATKKSPKKKKD